MAELVASVAICFAEIKIWMPGIDHPQGLTAEVITRIVISHKSRRAYVYSVLGIITHDSTIQA